MWTQIAKLFWLCLLYVSVDCNIPCKIYEGDLMNSFIQPTVGEKDVIFVKYSKDMKPPRNTTRLYVSVGTRNTVDLSFLFELNVLQELWLSYGENGKGCVKKDGGTTLQIDQWKNTTLPIKKLHVNVRISGHDVSFLNTLWPILTELQVLDISGSYLLGNNASFRFVDDGFYFSKIKALSLKRTLYRMGSLKMFVFDFEAVLESFRKAPLEYLDVSSNHLTGIRGSIIALFPQLRVVDASENQLQEDFCWLALLEVLILHPKIEAIILEDKEQTGPSCYRTVNKRFRRDTFIIGPIRKCLHFYNTTVNEAIFHHDTFCKVALCTMVESTGFPSFFDYYKDIPCKYLPTFNKLSSLRNSSCFSDFTIPLAPNLCEVRYRTLHDSKAIILPDDVGNTRSFCFYCQNKLRVLALGNIESKDYNSFKTTGLDSLTVLKLQNLKAALNLDSNMFTSFPSLTEIDLTHNYVNLSDNLFDIALGQQIRLLNISFNNISDENLPLNMIKNATALESINLAGNKLSSFNLDVSGSPSLTYLNLTSNNIQHFTPATIRTLKESYSARHHVLEIDLKDNDLLCTCDEQSMQTISLIQMSYKFNIKFIAVDKYVCISEKSAKRMLVKNVDLNDLKNTCNPSYTRIILLVICSNAVVIFIISFTLVCYKFRYRWYTAILRYKWSRHERQIGESFTYDAFVSYCAEDRFWVHGTLMKELENNSGFKLCIHYRDFGFGDIADVILDNILISRCVVIILSQLSLQSKWCDFELKAAHEQSLRNEKRLIILKLGDVQVGEDTSPLVKELLDGRVYIEWPEVKAENRDQGRKNKKLDQKRNIFWAKLKSSLYYKQNESGCLPCKKFGYREFM